MKDSDKMITELMKISYLYASYKTGNGRIADDISSTVLSLYVLKMESIKDTEAEAWIISATTKLCNKFFARQKKESKLHEQYSRNNKEDLYGYVKIETNTKLRDAYYKALDTLTEEQMASLNLYYHCEKKYRLMSLIAEVQESTLRQRISRVNKKLRAETFLALGVIASKKIVTPNLNSLLYNFLNRFKTNLENNTLSKMYYYFAETDLKNYSEDIHIKSITDYDVEIENGLHKIYVFYENHQELAEAFSFTFKVNKNQLKIISPPKLHENVTFIEADSEMAKQIKELLEKYPDDEFGKSTVPDEILEEIISRHNERNT
jgi:DNA-directed RNA polymerase specialized sigma24 family protein